MDRQARSVGVLIRDRVGAAASPSASARAGSELALAHDCVAEHVPSTRADKVHKQLPIDQRVGGHCASTPCAHSTACLSVVLVAEAPYGVAPAEAT